MSIKRAKSNNGGRSFFTPEPNFSESLLMEILIQLISPAASDKYIKKVLTRAGFSESEIEERLS